MPCPHRRRSSVVLGPSTTRRPLGGGRRALGGRECDQSSPPWPPPPWPPPPWPPPPWPPPPRPPWPPLSSPASMPAPPSSFASWFGPSSAPRPRSSPASWFAPSSEPRFDEPRFEDALFDEPRFDDALFDGPRFGPRRSSPALSSEPRLRPRSSPASWFGPSSAPRPRSSPASSFGPSSAPRPRSSAASSSMPVTRSSLASWATPSSAPRARRWCGAVVVVVVVVRGAAVVAAGSSAPWAPMAVTATVPPARSVPLSAAMRSARRMSVVAPAVTAAAARALDEGRHPCAVGAAHVGLDAVQPGAQAGEAADALEARAARDLDGRGAALGVAQTERAGAAVDGHDRALELAGRALRGRCRRGGLRRRAGGDGGGADRGDRCGDDGDLPDSHLTLLGGLASGVRAECRRPLQAPARRLQGLAQAKVRKWFRRPAAVS